MEKNEVEKSDISWGSIEKIIETDQHIFIYIGPIKAYVVPKVAFRNMNEKNEFLNYIQERRMDLKK